MVPLDPDLAPGTRLGDWVVQSKIGEGGMGTVYAALHAEIGKHAAIKVIRAALCATEFGGERFVQEARVVNQIGHPNIVDIFHIGRLADGRPYLVMELLRGSTLAERLDAGRVLVADGLDLLLQICSALTAAHDAGVIHRDLKPDNIFIADTHHGPQVKLVDWGIAKLSAPGLSAGTVTRSGVLIGTPQYISPEQARGKPVDAGTDIYSLGAIAYELLLEAPPFTADNVADLITMHLREPVPPPSDVWPDIPPALEALLIQMLAKEPADRPTLARVVDTLTAVRAELERARSQRQRLATGSLPPPFADAATGRLDTLPFGAPIAAAASRSGPTRALGSGPMAVVDPVAHGVAEYSTPIAKVRLPSPTPTQLEPPPFEIEPAGHRWRWIAVGTVVAVAVVAAIILMGSRDRRDARRAPAPPPAPAPEAPVGAPADSAPPPPAMPAIVPARLELEVSPAGARVHIDGVQVPVVDGRVLHDLAPGRHDVVVDARGHTTVRRSIDVGAGATFALDVRLDRAERRPPRRSDRRAPAEPVNPDGTIDPFE
jgi:serine/threonine-protein kinase